jgi:hypothetical protein
MTHMNRRFTFCAPVMALVVCVLVAGCGTRSILPKPVPVYERESFDVRSRFSREFVASPADTCNAARRALLSQGYAAPQAPAGANDQVQGHKRFQPEGDTHVQIDFTVVCAPSSRNAPTTVAFVNAVQDRYALKKSSTSASVGVAPFGSISVPVSQSSEALIKVASETIPDGAFYERFFDLVESILATQKGLD